MFERIDLLLVVARRPLLRAPRIGCNARGRGQQKCALLSALHRVELSRQRGEDMLHGIVHVGRRHAETTQRTPDHAKVGGQRLNQTFVGMSGPGQRVRRSTAVRRAEPRSRDRSLLHRACLPEGSCSATPFLPCPRALRSPSLADQPGGISAPAELRAVRNEPQRRATHPRPEPWCASSGTKTKLVVKRGHRESSLDRQGEPVAHAELELGARTLPRARTRSSFVGSACASAAVQCSSLRERATAHRSIDPTSGHPSGTSSEPPRVPAKLGVSETGAASPAAAKCAVSAKRGSISSR